MSITNGIPLGDRGVRPLCPLMFYYFNYCLFMFFIGTIGTWSTWYRRFAKERVAIELAFDGAVTVCAENAVSWDGLERPERFGGRMAVAVSLSGADDTETRIDRSEKFPCRLPRPTAMMGNFQDVGIECQVRSQHIRNRLVANVSGEQNALAGVFHSQDERTLVDVGRRPGTWIQNNRVRRQSRYLAAPRQRECLSALSTDPAAQVAVSAHRVRTVSFDDPPHFEFAKDRRKPARVVFLRVAHGDRVDAADPDGFEIGRNHPAAVIARAAVTGVDEQVPTAGKFHIGGIALSYVKEEHAELSVETSPGGLGNQHGGHQRDNPSGAPPRAPQAFCQKKKNDAADERRPERRAKPARDEIATRDRFGPAQNRQ